MRQIRTSVSKVLSLFGLGVLAFCLLLQHMKHTSLEVLIRCSSKCSTKICLEVWLTFSYPVALDKICTELKVQPSLHKGLYNIYWLITVSDYLKGFSSCTKKLYSYTHRYLDPQYFLFVPSWRFVRLVPYLLF